MITSLLAHRRALVATLSFALAGFSVLSSADAGTIIKLGLGSDTASDIEFDGTTLHTLSDGGPGTGDQQTGVDYLGILTGETNIPAALASFSLSGLAPSGTTTVFGGNAFIQAFQGGSFELYGTVADGNPLLLSGTLDESLLSGAISTGSGGVFTTNFGSFTGGSLMSALSADSLTMSISIEDANFSVDGNDMLGAFDANAQVTIGGDPIPEPTSVALALVAGAAGVMVVRRRK